VADRRSPALSAGAHRRWLAATGVICVILVVFNACSPSRVFEAASVVDDIRAGGGASLLKDRRPPPSRTAIVYEIDGIAAEGDLYRPADEIRARMVLVPGVTPAGRNDRRLVEFASTLARARFEVLVPDLVEMRSLRVTADDAVPIADAVRFLDRDDDGKPIGIAAVSFAVGPALISLFDPDAGPRVDFVLSIGGYYDLEALVTFITTGYHRPDDGGPWQFLSESRLAKWVFLFSNASRLDDDADRALLETMAERKLNNHRADVSDLVLALGPAGRSVYAVFSNTDPQQAAALWSAMPPEILAQAVRLDLRNWKLETLRPQFVLIHDRNDRVVPAEHSRHLAAALPAAQTSVYFIGSLRHADPQPPGLRDAIQMGRAVYEVLSLRDGLRRAE
jgi:hypothetical protein